MLIALLMAQAINCGTAQTQLDLDVCAGQAAKRADAALNAQWTQTLAFMHGSDKAAVGDPTQSGGPSYADALLSSQRAWLKFRDAECLVEGYAARGGSLQPMVVAGCMETLTRARTKALARMVKSQ